MRRIVTLSAVLTALVVAVATPALTQERKPVKVTRSVVVTGVVIVEISKDGKKGQLQCNQGLPGCAELKIGGYLMAELPENTGAYDCKNVEIYEEGKQNDEEAQPLGNYCLIEK